MIKNKMCETQKNEEENSLWDTIVESIEELTNKIASAIGSNQDDLHDRSNWF